MEEIEDNTAKLINKCRNGDNGAYLTVYKLYSRAMYNVGFRLVNDPDEAKDILQEAFISAFRSLDSYRGESSFGIWLKRIVINKAINHIKRKRMERIPDQENWDVADDEVLDEFDQFPYSVEQVRRAIEMLPGGYRVVFSLYLVEGYDHSEIAEILGITESTSKSQFNRSKKKLKEILGGTNL